MKVLVGFDGTVDAQAAVKYATRKVREQGGNLIVFTVRPEYPHDDPVFRPKAEKTMRQESLTRLEAALQIVRTHGPDVRAHLFTVDSNPDEILRYAENENVDLVVAPPSFESIAGKAFCLVDIVTADEDDTKELAQGSVGFDDLAEAKTWRFR